jgi:hypothetical protein
MSSPFDASHVLKAELTTTPQIAAESQLSEHAVFQVRNDYVTQQAPHLRARKRVAG